MKTPEEIADKLQQSAPLTATERQMMIAAIEADRAQRAEPVDPDWQDDADDMRDADHVEIRWTARNAKGQILFNSDDSISGAQAAAMFEAIGRTA